MQRDDTDKPTIPHFSNTVAPLDSKGIETLEKRIVDALGNNSHCIQMDIVDKKTDSVYQTVVNILSCGETDYVVHSKEFAEKLSMAQISRKIPGGILAVIIGTIGASSKKCCALVKAEVHTGFHKSGFSGNLTIEYLADLFLTPQQKLYKIGFFIANNDAYDAFIYDHNMTRSESTQAAKYFYFGFLGCKIAESNKAQTQQFYLLTREYINDLDSELTVKLNYQDSLYGYLRNEVATTIGVKEFAEANLQIRHRDKYLAYMRVSHYPEQGIVKDLSLIKNKLRRRNIRFSSGVKILRVGGSLSDVIRIISSDQTETTVAIKGKIEDQKV